ncbi:Uncharacterised protein [Legionella steigerwaltii]|uniref:Uncharacterized protein n=1 Tax=Legionella steigerwaltii TaxID=460 RepID=A0A378L581_9GAMM|nr:hypothetical protein [Legionella steigerwaltii]KTD77240.1 hypothetical protein Lstg_1597 [Legionella steigerwaltii]STY21966.1 Uncharacterised protein [Legionella steigerwaltii]
MATDKFGFFKPSGDASTEVAKGVEALKETVGRLASMKGNDGDLQKVSGNLNLIQTVANASPEQAQKILEAELQKLGVQQDFNFKKNLQDVKGEAEAQTKEQEQVENTSYGMK